MSHAPVPDLARSCARWRERDMVKYLKKRLAAVENGLAQAQRFVSVLEEEHANGGEVQEVLESVRVAERRNGLIAQRLRSMQEAHETGRAFETVDLVLLRMTYEREQASKALVRATRWLDAAEVFTSPRIANEELGDAIEDLRRFHRERRPCWHIYVHAAVCVALALWHTWGDKITALRRRGG